MPTAPRAEEFDLRFGLHNEAVTLVDLTRDDLRVSGCCIVPHRIRIGAATIRMDGIGGVWTHDEFRNCGCARRVVETAIDRMTVGDAALTMLYGIPNLYTKFGYATAGPDHTVSLHGPFDDAAPPAGWRVRPFAAADLPALQAIYDFGISAAAGAAVRLPGGNPWQTLVSGVADGTDECCVAVGPDGRVAAYAWQVRNHWEVRRSLVPAHPDALVVGEVVASGPEAADAILEACRIWARDEASRRAEVVRRVLIPLPPRGPVAAAAMLRRSDFAQRYAPAAESMARVLDVGRLLGALEPELSARWRDCRDAFIGTLTIDTDLGAGTLDLSPEGARIVEERSAAADGITARMPQFELARLALGAFPPESLLERLDPPPCETALRVLARLFPHRHPHMAVPDRY